MRMMLWIITTVLLLAAAGLAAAGWVFSSQILVPAPYQLFPEWNLGPVREVSEGRYEVVLPVPSEVPPPQAARSDAEGTFGLLWEGGAGRLGPVLGRGDGTVVRRVDVTRGTPPSEGLPARIDVTLFATPADRDLAYEDVTIPGPLGPLPAWWLPADAETGDPTTAIVSLHGRRRADRTETLRLLPTLAASGASVLAPSYRNHDASPASPDGYFHYGATEVEDAAAALTWLAGQGVERVVLVGYSMGGAIQLGLLADDPADAPEVLGVILDSPMIDPFAAFRIGAEKMGIPLAEPLAAWATRVAGWRAGIDFAVLDRRATAPQVDVPVLLIAGTGDMTTPIEEIDGFAAALPQAPTYLRLDGVEHVEAWNEDPERYEASVATFLQAVLPR